MKHDFTTVHQLRAFLDNFPYDAKVTFLIDDHVRASIWEMYAVEQTPVITLKSIVAQDYIENWNIEPDGAA